ncbi:MAG: MarR family winged helix-turn-helix transcriptional regulator [Lachnospiraceae bacterium]
MERECTCIRNWNTNGGMPVKCTMDVSRNLARFLDYRMNDTGLTTIQSRMLGHILMQEKQGKSVFQRDIENIFRIRRSSVTSVLQLLEKKGYIRRENVPGDARMKKLVATEEGCKMQKHTLDKLAGIEKEVREIFPEEELQLFFGLMKKLDEGVLNLYHNKHSGDMSRDI